MDLSATNLKIGKVCFFPDHGNLRLIDTGQCVICASEDDATRRAKARAKGKPYRPDVKERKRLAQGGAKVRKFKPSGGAYVAGSPCKRGHPGIRYKSTGACVACCQAYERTGSRSGHDAIYDERLFRNIVEVEWAQVKPKPIAVRPPDNLLLWALPD